jgi:hypothetical protein
MNTKAAAVGPLGEYDAEALAISSATANANAPK